jgi:hypothetical protein
VAPDTSLRSWTRVNTAMAECATVTLAGPVAVFAFGVVFTHGVYGSRMAWLFGVVLPLLAITAPFAFGAAKYGAKWEADRGLDRRQTPFSSSAERDSRRGVAEAIGFLALGLIATPFVLAGFLLLVMHI